MTEFFRYYRPVKALSPEREHPITYESFGGVTLYVRREEGEQGDKPLFHIKYALTNPCDRFVKKTGQEVSQQCTDEFTVQTGGVTDIFEAVVEKLNQDFENSEEEVPPEHKNDRRLLLKQMADVITTSYVASFQLDLMRGVW